MTTEQTSFSRLNGLSKVPLAIDSVERKDFISDQEARWCPGCGNYSILAGFQALMPQLGIPRENVVIISGIGCSSRFPYYVDAYGMHTIHGRATAIASGVATTREDLAVFVITGDGDALSIGGNHLIHAMRRNVNMNILLFNNRIYGLTKGQYSPTSEFGKVTKSSPLGSIDRPFDPISVALGAEATFVARTIDSERDHLVKTLKAAVAHRGTSLVEIYQNCVIFNDGAFSAVKGPEAHTLRLEHGQEITCGDKVVVSRSGQSVELVDRADADPDSIVIHDAHAEDPMMAFALARLSDTGVITQAPIGVFRDVDRPTYDDLARNQVHEAAKLITDVDRQLQEMVTGSDTWEVL